MSQKLYYVVELSIKINASPALFLCWPFSNLYQGNKTRVINIEHVSYFF